MPLDLTALGTLAADYALRDPQDILELALHEFSPDLGIAFSGAEDVVLIDMAAKLGAPFTVFSLDTGRLHPETYQFIEKVRSHYGIPITTMFPQPDTRSAAASARSSR
jgi:phosphoadenosine phosphosulfate reductase